MFLLQHVELLFSDACGLPRGCAWRYFFRLTSVNSSRFFCLYLLFWSRMTSGCFLQYLLFCSRKISGCFLWYLFLCSRCFRFLSINSMRGSLFALSSSTSVLSSCVLSSFTASFKAPSSWTFKKLVRSSKPSLLFSSVILKMD